MTAPLKWRRVEPGLYHGRRRGFNPEYAIQRRGSYWRVRRRYPIRGGDTEELALCSSYRAAKTWAQHLADGEIPGTPEADDPFYRR